MGGPRPGLGTSTGTGRAADRDGGAESNRVEPTPGAGFTDDDETTDGDMAGGDLSSVDPRKVRDDDDDDTTHTTGFTRGIIIHPSVRVGWVCPAQSLGVWVPTCARGSGRDPGRADGRTIGMGG